MKSKELVNIKKNVKILLEADKIEDLLNILSTDSDLIVIGLNEVTIAAEKGAIKELFLTDELIRGTSKTHKLKIEKILTDVENYGGTINILSSKHPTGQQIIDLGSLLGILRYKF
jgi:stalled ribosome rescue protein Dom34